MCVDLPPLQPNSSFCSTFTTTQCVVATERLRMDAIWNSVHQERAALIRDLHRLSPDDWGVESLCQGWRIRDVVAHLLDTATTTPTSFLTGMARAGFNFDRQNEFGLERYRSKEPEEPHQPARAGQESNFRPAPVLGPISHAPGGGNRARSGHSAPVGPSQGLPAGRPQDSHQVPSGHKHSVWGCPREVGWNQTRGRRRRVGAR